MSIPVNFYFSANVEETKYQERFLFGQKYYVLPVVMMVEGAYTPNIEAGDPQDVDTIYFPSAVLQKSLKGWNGRPIMRNHPDGFISSNDPNIYEKQWVGYIFNASYNAAKKALSAEAWLNVDKSEDIILSYTSGKKIDISIGAYGDLIDTHGIINGKKYTLEIKNLVPDHLAILLDDVGACSNRDGCGLGIAASQNLFIVGEKMISKDKEISNDLSVEEENIDQNIKIMAILSTARTPKYAGTETISWADVGKTIDDYVNGYFKHSNKTKPDDFVKRVADMPAEVKNWIASKSLLGDPQAEDGANLVFFPVVNPGTNKLNAGALRAVLSGRGAQADIPDAAKKSAQTKARGLLDKEFKKETEMSSKEFIAEEQPAEVISSQHNECDRIVSFEEKMDAFIKEIGDNDLREALVEAVEERTKKRNQAVEIINAFDRVKFCEKFLSAIALDNLVKISELVMIANKKDQDKSIPTSTDFGLQGAPPLKVLKYVPPAKISWDN